MQLIRSVAASKSIGLCQIQRVAMWIRAAGMGLAQGAKADRTDLVGRAHTSPPMRRQRQSHATSGLPMTRSGGATAISRMCWTM